jgi:hypothetical protein
MNETTKITMNVPAVTGAIPSHFLATKWINNDTEVLYSVLLCKIEELKNAKCSLRKNSTNHKSIDEQINEANNQIKSLKTVADFSVSVTMFQELKSYSERLRLSHLRLLGKIPFYGINHLEWEIVNIIKTQFTHELLETFINLINIYSEKVKNNPELSNVVDPYAILAHCETIFNKQIEKMITGEYCRITNVSSSEGHNFIKKCQLECLINIFEDGIHQGCHKKTKFNETYNYLVESGFLKRFPIEEFEKIK